MDISRGLIVLELEKEITVLLQAEKTLTELENELAKIQSNIEALNCLSDKAIEQSEEAWQRCSKHTFRA